MSRRRNGAYAIDPSTGWPLTPNSIDIVTGLPFYAEFPYGTTAPRPVKKPAAKPTAAPVTAPGPTAPPTLPSALPSAVPATSSLPLVLLGAAALALLLLGGKRK